MMNSQEPWPPLLARSSESGRFEVQWNGKRPPAVSRWNANKIPETISFISVTGAKSAATQLILRKLLKDLDFQGPGPEVEALTGTVRMLKEYVTIPSSQTGKKPIGSYVLETNFSSKDAESLQLLAFCSKVSSVLCVVIDDVRKLSEVKFALQTLKSDPETPKPLLWIMLLIPRSDLVKNGFIASKWTTSADFITNADWANRKVTRVAGLLQHAQDSFPQTVFTAEALEDCVDGPKANHLILLEALQVPFTSNGVTANFENIVQLLCETLRSLPTVEAEKGSAPGTPKLERKPSVKKRNGGSSLKSKSKSMMELNRAEEDINGSATAASKLSPKVKRRTSAKLNDSGIDLADTDRVSTPEAPPRPLARARSLHALSMGNSNSVSPTPEILVTHRDLDDQLQAEFLRIQFDLTLKLKSRPELLKLMNINVMKELSPGLREQICTLEPDQVQKYVENINQFEEKLRWVARNVYDFDIKLSQMAQGQDLIETRTLNSITEILKQSVMQFQSGCQPEDHRLVTAYKLGVENLLQTLKTQNNQAKLQEMLVVERAVDHALQVYENQMETALQQGYFTEANFLKLEAQVSQGLFVGIQLKGFKYPYVWRHYKKMVTERLEGLKESFRQKNRDQSIVLERKRSKVMAASLNVYAQMAPFVNIEKAEEHTRGVFKAMAAFERPEVAALWKVEYKLGLEKFHERLYDQAVLTPQASVEADEDPRTKLQQLITRIGATLEDDENLSNSTAIDAHHVLNEATELLESVTDLDHAVVNTVRLLQGVADKLFA